MKSKLVYVPKSDYNQGAEIFQLLKKMDLEEFKERCKSLSMFLPEPATRLVVHKKSILGFGISVTHYPGFIAIEGNDLSEIIEAAWVIDTGKTFEDNLTDDMYY